MIDPAAAPGPPPRRHPRQNLILALAGVLLAAVVVIVLVVTLGGGADGPAAGSPDAVTDQLATALRAHDQAQVGAVACGSARSAVVDAVQPVLTANTAAQRSGSTAVSGANAVGRIVLDVSGSKGVPATVALRQVGDSWCIDGFAVALPKR